MILDKKHFLSLDKFFWLAVVMVWLAVGSTSAEAQEIEQPKAYSTQTLTKMLASGDTIKQHKAQQQLKKIGQPAMPDLIRISQKGPTDQRAGAIIGLALMPIPELTINALVATLADPDIAIRSLAARALVKIGAPAAPSMASLLESKNHNKQIGAGFALSKMKTQAVPALAKTLNTEEPIVRAKAAWILGRMGADARPAIPALIRALNTNDMRLLHIVAEAIDLIGADPAMIAHELILLGAQPSACPFRLDRLGEKAAPTLTTLLGRPGTPMAQISLYTLSTIGNPAEPALLKALKKGNASQRTAAALLLSDMDPPIIRSLPDDLRKSLAGARHSD